MPKIRHIAPEMDTPAWREWVERLPELCDAANPEQRLPGGRNEVLLFEHLGRRLVVKRFRNRGLWKKVAYRITTSKARRSFEHSQRIIEAGLLSPTPIAWLEEWSGSWLQQSFYVCEFQDYVHDAYALADPSLPDRIEKAECIGRTCGRLHEAKIAHLDLNSGNLLFSQDPDRNWQIHIIDNNRIRFQSVSPKLACSLLLRAALQDDVLDATLNTYAQTRSFPTEAFRSRYLAKRKIFLLNRRIRDATRPWRKRLGL